VTVGFRSKSLFPHDTGATGAWSITAPAGIADDDLLLAFVGAIGTSVTFSGLSGWTLLAAETSNANMNLSCYYKVASSESGPYSVTPSIGAKGAAWIGAYTGVDTSTPIDAHANGLVLSSTTAPPAATLVTSGSWLATCGFGRHPFANHSMTTSDGSDTERDDHGSTSGSGSDYVIGVYDSNRALTSGSNGRTLTASGSENQFGWHAVALRPAGAALTGRLYRAELIVPPAVPALRGRLYRAALRVPAASGGLTGRLYRAALRVPTGGVVSGKSGVYAAVDGGLGNVAVYAVVGGELT
jgi:hypothetical protein